MKSDRTAKHIRLDRYLAKDIIRRVERRITAREKMKFHAKKKAKATDTFSERLAAFHQQTPRDRLSPQARELSEVLFGD